jgi:WD40 repeat protein
LSRLFISHSSKDSVAAIAFKQWLGINGWPEDDVFLDLEDIGAGEVWKEALRKAHLRCEAVLLLASPDALSSPECLAEVRKAEDFGKEIIVVLLRDLTIEDQRLGSFKERQIVDLSAPPLTHTEKVNFRDTQHDVRFNNGALLKIKDYLFRRGITPDSFPWPPGDKPDAEPFPGLRAFTEDEAGVFFGRDADILHGLDEFRLLRRNGSPRILAIQASSGAGKSSFLRAGLWPRLCRDPDFAALAIVRPAQGILTGPDGLARKLAPQLSRPNAPVNPGEISARLMAQDAARTVAEFARIMTAAAADAHEQRRIVNPNAPPPALVIAIDQAEELLAPEDADESQRFLALLGGLMREPPPGVEPFALITVRADSSTRVYQAIVDQKLEAPKTLTLLPLPQTSYRDVILKPIELMARRGKRITISPALVDQLVGDAAGADALPLLAFTLSYLYQAYAPGGTIGLEQYNEIGGVAGAIDKALKQALARPGDAPAIPAAPAEQLACLRATFIPWLTRLEPETNEPKRRVARLDEFAGTTRAMVDRLVRARLLVVDRRGGIDVVEVAHESVLRQWPPLASWLQAVADDLRVVDSVERAAGEWVGNGRLAAWLDHRADRLSAAERVAAQEDFRRRLGSERLEYLAACRAREKRQRRIAQAVAWSVAAAFAIFCVVLFFEWQQTLRAKQETEREKQKTEASLMIARSELARGSGNIEAAVAQAKSAFLSVPSAASRSQLLQAALEISPHAAAVLPLGADTIAEALGWASGTELDFAVGSGRMRTLDLNAQSKDVAGWNLPVIKRPQEGNPAAIRALSALDGDRMIVVFDEGSIGLYRRGTHEIRVQPPDGEISVNPLQHGVATAPSGALIAMATNEAAILVYRCDWASSRPPALPCQRLSFGDVQGRVVAISPDEKRIAVGDTAGKLTIYDLSGQAIGSAKSFDAPINALGWAQQRDWLAVGTVKGQIAMLDVAAQEKTPIQEGTFRDQSIAALAWSPKELSLAFTCNGTAVCVWQASGEAHAPKPFKPAVRMEGHRLAVTLLRFDPSGTRLASISPNGSLRIWNLAQDSGVSCELYGDDMAEVGNVAVSPDGGLVAGGSTDGTVQIWDAKTCTSRKLVRPSNNYEVRDLAWNHAGTVASLDDNDTVNVTNAIGSLPPVSIPIRTRAGRHLAWADEDRMIAVAMNENGVILLDPQSPSSDPDRLDADGAQAWGVTAVPNSRLLAVSYVGGEIKVWDLASRKVVGSMRDPQIKEGNRIGVGSLSVSPDGRLLAVSSGDRFLRVYDIAGRVIWRALPTDANAIVAAAFSPDGSRLAALGNDKRLYVWVVAQGPTEPYLAAGIVPQHRAIVGDAARRAEYAGWLDWVGNDRVALATGIAAITVISLDPTKWLERIDDLALGREPPIN